MTQPTPPSPPPLVGLDLDAFRLDGQTALITGGDRGIGASIALTFAQAGADVVIVARNEQRLEATSTEIAGRVPASTVTPILADISTAEVIADVLSRLERDAIAIDILVNNAATYGGRLRSFVELQDWVWDDTWATNVLAPSRLIQGLAPAMLERGHGNIINVLSNTAFVPVMGRAPYGAAKAALWHLTRYLATEFAPTVRVNALSPGVVSEDGQPRT
jgi:NAD(P)-dependent dehydrogenase (short-subunit alcohol dehydrogenase family)